MNAAPSICQFKGTAVCVFGLLTAVPASADIAEDCQRIGQAAAWTVFAGYGPDVTPERVIETTPITDDVSTFDDLVWDDERVHDLISQIIASKFEIDRSDEGMTKSFFIGEFFRLQCVAEAERNIRFKKLPEAKPAIEECIETSASSRFSFELCLLDSAVDKESWKDYSGPMKEETE